MGKKKCREVKSWSLCLLDEICSIFLHEELTFKLASKFPYRIPKEHLFTLRNHKHMTIKALMWESDKQQIIEPELIWVCILFELIWTFLSLNMHNNV